MFYSNLVLTKKGPLGKVWIAATLGESKVSKSFAVTAQIHVLCQNIEQPAAPFALRLSSALMLGVVRVFSRKSTIILADTNSVLHAVKRYSTQHSTQLSGKKRSRVTTHLAEGHEAGINLQEGNDKARFDLITLPARKRVKASRKGAHKKQGAALSRSAGSYSCDFRSNGSLLLSDPSFGDSVEIDVLTAMQNVFPMVAVPRLGENLPSGLSSPTSVHNLGNQRKMLYSARDQDITLSQPMRGLDQLAFDVFDEDLRGSIRSDPMSNVGDSRPLWMTGVQGNGDQVQQNDALSLAPSRSQASGGHATISPFSHGEVNLEPMEIEPLDIPATDQAPVTSAKKKSRESSRLISLAVSSPRRTASDFKTPNRPVQTNKEFSRPQATNSSRKRRSAILRLDDTTEMSPSEVRNCLNDTTDILLTGFDERRREKQRGPKGLREHATFEVPGILASFSNNITDLWKSMTVPPFMAMGGKEQTRAQPSTHGRNPPTVRSRTENVLRTQNDPEPVEFALQDEQGMVPVLDVGRVVPGRRNSSSADVDRANSDPSKAPSADLLSFPSNSAQGGSHSKHGTTATGHGSSDHYRDFLDRITASDHQAFDIARQRDREIRRGKESRDPHNSTNNSSREREGMSDGSGLSAAKLPVKMSDFELVEETERAEDSHSARGGPIFALNIRAFKMWETLRRMPTPVTVASSEESPTFITTFHNVLNGCSRGAAARAFFSVLSLVNSRFIDVEQQEPYGTLSLHKGQFF